MNLAVKMTISGILRDFKLGKHVESPYFNQLGILVRSSTENKIMSQNPPPVLAGFNPENSISLKYTLFSRFSILWVISIVYQGRE